MTQNGKGSLAWLGLMIIAGLSLCFWAIPVLTVPRSLRKSPVRQQLPRRAGRRRRSRQAVSGAGSHLQAIEGVDRAEPGYAGGNIVNPSYEQVETGTTGHAESVNIIYDPKVISYRELLEVLLTTRNPTTKDQQGTTRARSTARLFLSRRGAAPRRKRGDTAVHGETRLAGTDCHRSPSRSRISIAPRIITSIIITGIPTSLTANMYCAGNRRVPRQIQIETEIAGENIAGRGKRAGKCIAFPAHFIKKEPVILPLAAIVLVVTGGLRNADDSGRRNGRSGLCFNGGLRFVFR